MTDVSKKVRGALISLLAAALIAATLAACAKKPQPVAPPAGQFTVVFVNAGTQELDPVPYPIDANLNSSGLAEFAVTQLLAGPATGRDAVVLFPAGTALDVSVRNDTATVNVTGTPAKYFSGGADDESAMFKSLTFTLTNVPGISRVQILVAGKRLAALPGGHLELDVPLTRETFAQ